MIDLRAERLNRGKSIEAMAADIGVTKRVLQAAENGARPHPPNALKIATFYGKTVTEMWPTEEASAA